MKQIEDSRQADAFEITPAMIEAGEQVALDSGLLVREAEMLYPLLVRNILLAAFGASQHAERAV